MLKYVLKRSAYSILVIFGVLLVTFFLFRLSAGDPAAVILGKNPSPREIEDLRLELSSNKPVLWGHWVRTEMFSSVDFREKHSVSGLEIEGVFSKGDEGIEIERGKLLFTRNFKDKDAAVRIEAKFRGQVDIQESGKSSSDSFTTESLIFHKVPEKIILATRSGCSLESVNFYRRQESPWDSQLFASLKELVTFRKSFPFLSFFNFGRTVVTKESVKSVLQRGIWPSLSLMIPIFAGEMLLGISLALVSTAWRGRWPDRILVFFSVAGMSVSYLVFIIFGQWYLGYYFNWFPVWGFESLRYLMLPIFIGIASGLGGGVRFYRTVFVNELNKEYLRTAEAKGCHPLRVYGSHLLRNAFIPVITRLTSILPFLFTGSLLLESFFGIPGLGYAGINALMNSDLQLLKALVLLTAMIFVFANLFADIAYAWADPRIRHNNPK